MLARRKLGERLRTRLAVALELAPRTLLKWERGENIRPGTRARIEQGLRDFGLDDAADVPADAETVDALLSGRGEP
jgi:hypothetical protein